MIMVSFNVALIYLKKKLYLPSRVRKEVWLESRRVRARGAKIRRRKKHLPSLFSNTFQKYGEWLYVPEEQNMGLHHALLI